MPAKSIGNNPNATRVLGFDTAEILINLSAAYF
jgi:hypothetical protein